jgi:hypothetical protein
MTAIENTAGLLGKLQVVEKTRYSITAPTRSGAQRPVPATLENVIDYLGPACGITFFFDAKRNRVGFAYDGECRLLDDVDTVSLRLELGRAGFAPVSRNRMLEALRFVARRRTVPQLESLLPT